MCFAIFKLIKFTCFGSTLSYPHKEFLDPRPTRTRTQSSETAFWVIITEVCRSLVWKVGLNHFLLL